MRLWSVSPSYLDPQGLVALWREGLLARKVLQGHTKGYKNHPQLIRFKQSSSPMDAINAYLAEVCAEATRRGYSFDSAKITPPAPHRKIEQIPVTQGQLLYEWHHLLRKLSTRAPERYSSLLEIEKPIPHPLFTPVPGNISPWEKIS